MRHEQGSGNLGVQVWDDHRSSAGRVGASFGGWGFPGTVGTDRDKDVGVLRVEFEVVDRTLDYT